MEARILPLPTTEIRVDGERIIIERLVLRDPTLAAVLAQREPVDRPAVVERALKVGLLAIQDVAVSMDVDLVRDEFEKLVQASEQSQQRATEALDQVLRANFADGDGRLPRTLERFLGDRGQLRAFVAELFDETKRDSAIGRMRTLLGEFFDGDASRLAVLLDPTRQHSPMHQFRDEMTAGFERLNERLSAIEAAAAARGVERARSAAKGGDFETVLAALLAESARGAGDIVDRTGDEVGEMLRSKKGDFVVTINPERTGGAEVRVVVEAKDRAMSVRSIREELREAKQNRAATVGLVVFSTEHAPAGIAPFDVRAGDVYCVIDPAVPDATILDASLRLAKLLAIASLREIEADVDAESMRASLANVRGELEALKGIKATLTSISNSATGVQQALDRLRDAIIAQVCEAEGQLAAGRSPGR